MSKNSLINSNFYYCRRFRLWGFGLFVLSAIGLYFATILLANPQWHRYIYILQFYYSPFSQPEPSNTYTGKWISWSKSGDVLKTTTFVHGIKHGPWATYGDGNVLFRQGFYYDDQKHGVEIEWQEVPPSYASSRFAITKNYHLGKLQGDYLVWDTTSGRLLVLMTYVDGVRNGKYRHWHTSGSLIEEGEYKDGVPYGVWLVWDKEGALIAKGIYKNGKPSNGTFRAPNSNWDFHLIQMYEDGIMVGKAVLTKSTTQHDLPSKTAQAESGSEGSEIENEPSPDAGVAPEEGAAGVNDQPHSAE